jgi:hypothetical protein
MSNTDKQTKIHSALKDPRHLDDCSSRTKANVNHSIMYRHTIIPAPSSNHDEYGAVQQLYRITAAKSAIPTSTGECASTQFIDAAGESKLQSRL